MDEGSSQNLHLDWNTKWESKYEIFCVFPSLSPLQVLPHYIFAQHGDKESFDHDEASAGGDAGERPQGHVHHLQHVGHEQPKLHRDHCAVSDGQADGGSE